MRKYVAILAFAVLALSCGPRGGKQQKAPTTRAFPKVEAPVMVEDTQERLEYIVLHFWDAFSKGDYPSDSLIIKGVKKDDVESQMGVFATLARAVPLSVGEKAMAALYECAASAPDAFGPMVDLTTRYFFDPNSPVRNEALYLPFVERLATSPLTKPEMRGAYEWDARMCALNRPGTVATDFRFIDTAGRSRTLYGVKSEYILLVFGNPDCNACRELVEDMSASPEISALEASGRLKVVDIYIDQEIDDWKAKAASYPKHWINGYDPTFTIRQDLIYNVRAIPSIYLLDAEKRVILKDAPEDFALQVLSSL